MHIIELGLVAASAAALELSPSKYLACSLLPILGLSSVKICKRIWFQHPNEAHSCSYSNVLRLVYVLMMYLCF